MLMGWPPAMFTVAATDTDGICSAPTCLISRSSLPISTFPLNGKATTGSCASSTTTS